MTAWIPYNIWRTYVVVFLLLSLKAELLSGEKVLGEEINEDFDFDGLPGVMHEFKVEVGRGSEECFYQRAAYGALLHVSFEVLRGGDRKADVVIRNSRWEVVDGKYWQTEGIMELTAKQEDTFVVCIDNTFSLMTGKLVYVYIMTFMLADWTQYMMEFNDLATVSGNLTNSLNNVELSLQEMLKFQRHTRFNVVMDYYLLLGNERYVQGWSIAQCVVIIGTSLAQVFFLRRMFRTTNVTPTAKPRA